MPPYYLCNSAESGLGPAKFGACYDSRNNVNIGWPRRS